MPPSGAWQRSRRGSPRRPPCSSCPRSTSSRRSCSRRGTTLGCWMSSRRWSGVVAGAAGRGEHEHDHLPAITADPFWVPELDQFISEHEPWVASDALARLQEIREEHAHAAGLVALSAATDAALDVSGARRRAEAVPARRRAVPAQAAPVLPRRRAGPRARPSRRWRRSRPTAPTRRSSSARPA